MLECECYHLTTFFSQYKKALIKKASKANIELLKFYPYEGPFYENPLF